MQNVVSLRPDRPRPQRALGMPRSGARILFFTGVRYCRDEDHDGSGDGSHDAHHVAALAGAHALHGAPASGRMLDAAAH